MSTQVAHKSFVRVQNSIISDERRIYQEHNHLIVDNSKSKLAAAQPRNNNNSDDHKQQSGHLLRAHHQQPTPETSDVDLDSGEQTRATTYADQQNGRAPRQSTRPSRPSRRPEISQQQQQPGDSPQRVRLSEHFIRAVGASGRSRSAAATPRLGQTRDHAPARVATRMGRFVDSYPASRQARSSGRSTSPYAFHVPPPPGSTLSRVRSSDRCAIYATPTSRATSPSYAYAEYSNNTDAEQPVSAPRRAVQYGYVARAEAGDRPAAASKFNGSLRSRTIAHLPSMVQVTNGELMHEETERMHGQDPPTGVVGAISEGDLLLNAHTIAWRSSDLGRENPFRPGTELSLEADLMVRLIKRGYPIDAELPRLVEAAKSEVAAKATSSRSKSCDRLAPKNRAAPVGPSQSQSQGYLRANLRREIERQQQQQRQPQLSRMSNSHQGLAWTGGHKPEVQAGAEPEVAGRLHAAKAVWASSLKRAKSVPRSGQTDADSLDQLITSIELEISDLLEKTTTKTTSGRLESKPPQQVAEHPSEKVISGHSLRENPRTLEEQCRGPEQTGGRSETGSPVKTRRPNKTPASPKRAAPAREATATPAATGAGLGTSVPRPQRTGANKQQVASSQPPTRAIKRKDKPKRCCSIQ